MAFYFTGCSQLWVTDGIWKLRLDTTIIEHTFTVSDCSSQYIVKQIPALTLPDVCTLSPLPGKAFCAEHTKVLEEHSPPIPTDIRGFLSFCGVLPSGRLCLSHNKMHDNVINYNKFNGNQ